MDNYLDPQKDAGHGSWLVFSGFEGDSTLGVLVVTIIKQVRQRHGRLLSPLLSPLGPLLRPPEQLARTSDGPSEEAETFPSKNMKNSKNPTKYANTMAWPHTKFFPKQQTSAFGTLLSSRPRGRVPPLPLLPTPRGARSHWTRASRLPRFLVCGRAEWFVFFNCKALLTIVFLMFCFFVNKLCWALLTTSSNNQNT